MWRCVLTPSPRMLARRGRRSEGSLAGSGQGAEADLSRGPPCGASRAPYYAFSGCGVTWRLECTFVARCARACDGGGDASRWSNMHDSFLEYFKLSH